MSVTTVQKNICISAAVSILLAQGLSAFAQDAPAESHGSWLPQEATTAPAANDPAPSAAATATPAPAGGDPLNLKGIISIYEGPSPDQLVGGLVNQAMQRDKAIQELDKKDQQMHGLVQKTIRGAKMTAHFMVEYRGFEMSSEGADIILDEKLRLKSASATDYAQQKKGDEIHAKVFSSLLQIGQGLGCTDPEIREKTIASGQSSLAELVGPEAAKEALDKLEAWSSQLNVPKSVFRKQPWSMMELQQKSDVLLKESAQMDPVMGMVRRALHKYNGHSKLALGAAKVINLGLNVAMFSPTLASPAAQILQFVYQMATGGPEDSKLLTELYLDKRLESRWRRLNQESNQAVNAYNNAIMTSNPVLLGLSESMITALGGEETGGKLIGQQKLIARKSTHNDAIDCVLTHTY